MKKTSILIHYTHKQTLGHTTRVLSIASELMRRYRAKISLTLLQGGFPQPFIKFPAGVRVIDIPAPFDTRASFRGMYSRGLHTARATFVLETARRIQPDIFITEFFPFGRLDYMDELLPTLRHLYQKGTRICASIGYPHMANVAQKNQQRTIDLIRPIMHMYDQFFIHTPRELENPYFLKSFLSPSLKKDYRNFLSSLQSKITYTGYILPHEQPLLKEHSDILKNRSGKFIVVVSRGGGAVYPKIIASAIKAQSLLGDRYRFIIACGPATTSTEKNLFNELLKKYPSKNVSLFTYIPDLSYFLKRCDVSISMCGYNTSVQLLRFGISNILVPFVNTYFKVSSMEQPARALLLRDLLESTVLPYENMSAETIAQAVKKHCSLPRPKPAPRDWFNGATATVRELLQTRRLPASSTNLS